MTVYPEPDSSDENPYATPVPVPYDPESPDNPAQGPIGSSPPGPPMVTKEQSAALQAEQIEAANAPE